MTSYPNIEIYTLSYNEEAIVPFMINYWKAIGASHVYVADNHSTDNTVKLLSQYPEWITITTLEMPQIDEMVYCFYKDNCWKGSKADLCIVCDFDEAIYSEDFQSVYEQMCKEDIDVIRCFGIICCSETFPKLEQENQLLHTLPNVKFNYYPLMCKPALIRPNRLSQTYYHPGAHWCDAIDLNDKRANITNGENLTSPVCLLHMKDFSEEYLIKKYRSSQTRLSDTNKQNKWGIHYNQSDEQIRAELHKKLDNGVNSIEECLNKRNTYY